MMINNKTVLREDKMKFNKINIGSCLGTKIIDRGNTAMVSDEFLVRAISGGWVGIVKKVRFEYTNFSKNSTGDSGLTWEGKKVNFRLELVEEVIEDFFDYQTDLPLFTDAYFDQVTEVFNTKREMMQYIKDGIDDMTETGFAPSEEYGRIGKTTYDSYRIVKLGF